MKKRRNIFFISLILVAVLIGVILIIGVIEKESTIAKEENKNDEVERIKNILNNSFFENELGKNNWQFFSKKNNAENGFDNLVKFEGEYSFSISNNYDSSETFLLQKISGVQIDKKFSLLGFIKTEDCDSVRFEIDLKYKDSILVSGYSQAVSGTTDWDEYNAWIKTFLNHKFDKKFVYADVKCVLYGKGRVWFDNVRLYSIPLKQSIYKFKSYLK